MGSVIAATTALSKRWKNSSISATRGCLRLVKLSTTPIFSTTNFGRKEGYGVDEILKGWARQGIADSKLLERGMQLVEGLYYALAK
jgi:hypothetical protein